MLRDGPNGGFFVFACICVCECVCVPRSLRGWPPAGECAVFLPAVADPAGFPNLPPRQTAGEARLCDEKPKEAAEEILRLPLFGEAGKPLVRKGLFSKPCFLLHT